MLPIDRRENVRIIDKIPLAYRFVTAEDIAENNRPERYFPYIWNKYPQLLPSEELEENHTKLLNHIIDLHRKMDILIETVAPECRTIVEIPKEQDVCISASGIRIHLDTPATAGQLMILCIVLPFIPPASIFVTGEVIRRDMSEDLIPDEKNYFETVINFLTIKEDDRETLIKYIFKRQRDMLRDRALEKGEVMQALSENDE
ncbi:MAG: PilZ domain-containing protein [Nitrospirae bacterium]|nr:PilZ domain-containing protein [Nitrospirota bacterium]